MKTKYLDAGNAAIALNFKVGSATLSRSVIQSYQSELESILTTPHGDGNGTAYPEGVSADTIRWHGKVAKCDPTDKGAVLLIVRDPVEKFRSACAEDNVADVGLHLDWLEANPEMSRRMHFWPQSRFLQSVDVQLYRFPEDLDALATAAGLQLPLPDITGEHNRPKPDLTPDELARVQAIYADDIALFNSITAAGQTWATPPEPVYVPTLVTSAQFKCALGAARFAQIESVLAAIPDADEQFEYTQYWLNTTEFKIDHPMVVAMQANLGWTDAERDQLFIDAGNK